MVDASALLAVLHDEPGSELVEEALEWSAISAVNWSEAYGRSLLRGVDVAGLRSNVEALGLAIVPFIADRGDPMTRRYGLEP